MADPASGSPQGHDRHDLLAVAAGVRPGHARPVVGALGPIGACRACLDLHDDIARILALLPGVAVPPRGRGYTLTAERAARLRRRGLREVVDRIGAACDGVMRPLAVGFSTLGLAGLLVASTPVGPAGTTGADGSRTLEHERAAPAASLGPMSSGPATGLGPDAAGGDVPLASAPIILDATRPEPGALQVLSASFLGVGAALFGLRRLAAQQRVR